MGLLKKIQSLFKKNKKEEVKVDEIPVNEDTALQTTFNEDGIDILVEEGVVENVVYNED